ncbi:hypothetical protein Tco_1104922 [Tanacetum coccineum]
MIKRPQIKVKRSTDEIKWKLHESFTSLLQFSINSSSSACALDPPWNTQFQEDVIVDDLDTDKRQSLSFWIRFQWPTIEQWPKCYKHPSRGLLRQCPHHGFSELHQLDTFYNSLNSNDQDALDSAAGGNFLDKMPQEGLAIIESKSKVRYSRSRANDSRVSTDAPLSNSSLSNNSFDMQQIAASLENKMGHQDEPNE